MKKNWIIDEDALRLPVQKLHAGYLGRPCLASSVNGRNTVMGQLERIEFGRGQSVAGAAGQWQAVLQVGDISITLDSTSTIVMLDLSEALPADSWCQAPPRVHSGGVRLCGGLAQPPRWGGGTVTGSAAVRKGWSGAVTVSGGGPTRTGLHRRSPWAVVLAPPAG